MNAKEACERVMQYKLHKVMERIEENIAFGQTIAVFKSKLAEIRYGCNAGSYDLDDGNLAFIKLKEVQNKLKKMGYHIKYESEQQTVKARKRTLVEPAKRGVFGFKIKARYETTEYDQSFTIEKYTVSFCCEGVK